MIHLDAAAQERLLGRPVRSVLSDHDRRRYAGQRVLVTGAGGTVGGELARQLARCAPASLVLFDHAEYSLFRIEQELRRDFPGLRLEPVLGDVSRRSDVGPAVGAARPHVVFHAAAYKHVTLAERSIVPAARTNVLGALRAAAAARDAGSRFVLISSDKAAEPRSVMGATKRFAELAILAMAAGRFRPAVVRFGNVLGSSGSVVEIMIDAVRTGRPVPVTHPDATRFFMTAQEAVSLVLRADRMGCAGDVFWLDMGDPLRIGHLAARIIEMETPPAAPRPRIEIVGLRPGEKMREELTAQGLEMRPTRHPAIWSARQRHIGHERVARAVRALRRACAQADALRALDAIASAVDDFVPSEAAVQAARASHRLAGSAGWRRRSGVETRVAAPQSGAGVS